MKFTQDTLNQLAVTHRAPLAPVIDNSHIIHPEVGEAIPDLIAQAQEAIVLREALEKVTYALKMWASGRAMVRADVWTITKPALALASKILET